MAGISENLFSTTFHSHGWPQAGGTQFLNCHSYSEHTKLLENSDLWRMEAMHLDATESWFSGSQPKCNAFTNPMKQKVLFTGLSVLLIHNLIIFKEILRAQFEKNPNISFWKESNPAGKIVGHSPCSSAQNVLKNLTWIYRLFLSTWKLIFQEEKFCLWNFANLSHVQRMKLAWKIPPVQF